jgi:riboflavin synthase
MFTGLVSTVGRVERAELGADAMRLVVASVLDGLALGESVAVSGVCLTVSALGPGSFGADLTRETLERTTLGRIKPGACVNLERAAALGDRLGGHLVTGHIDGVARVVASEAVGDARRVALEAPPELMRYIAEKGSVALDGVSLTVNTVGAARFDIMLIPHTLAVTTLADLAPGRELNLEVDLVARYVARLLEAGTDADRSSPSRERGVA